MELPERKMKILQAIIRNYLESGEPVGSRTISKYTDLNLSSATIRNEMSDLEEMGLIMQPHTSAGRIPTDKGYRIYVDDMLRNEKKEVSDLKDVLLEKQDHLENLLQQVAKLLAANTNYASMISAPVMSKLPSAAAFLTASTSPSRMTFRVLPASRRLAADRIRASVPSVKTMDFGSACSFFSKSSKMDIV